MNLNDLYTQFFTADCIKFGEFKLKSGIMSPIYVDFRVLVSKPELLRKVGEAVAAKLDEMDYDLIAGIPYAGIPIAVAASLASGKPMIYPRKEVKDYGTAKAIEGEFQPGQKVVVIDDIITDGASKIEAIKPLEEAGLVVKDVLIVLDREQGGGRILEKAGYELRSVGKLSEVLEALVGAGKISDEQRTEVAEFITGHQFG